MTELISTTTVAILFVSALLIRLLYSWLLPKPIPGIPHNPVTSVWGDLPAIKRSRQFSGYVTDMATAQGPISQVLLARQCVVVVNDRAEAERIALGAKTVETVERVRSIFSTALPRSQLSLPTIPAPVQDDEWKMHRRLAGPSMSRRYLQNMSSRIASGANELVGLWRAKCALVGSNAFDAAFDFEMATMDNIVNITLGESVGCIKSASKVLPLVCSESTNVAHFPHPEPPPLYTARVTITAGFERAWKSPFPKFSTWLFTYTSPTWRKYHKLATSFFKDAIACAREREERLAKTGQGLSTSADCVLDMIVQRETQEGVEALGDQDILDELATYVFAGQDTTAVILSWLVKYLPTDSVIQRRLHEEMLTVFGDSESNESLDFNLLDNPERVPILEAIVAETLRCASVGAFLGRKLLKDEVILDRFVPKGTLVLFTTEMMSKNESEWGPDANEWRPSRWLTPDGAFNRSAGPSIPFGMGQRSCFGQRLAVLQLKTYLATMSREFFFKPVPPEVDTWEIVEVILRRPKSCHISLEGWDLKDVS